MTVAASASSLCVRVYLTSPWCAVHGKFSSRIGLSTWAATTSSVRVMSSKKIVIQVNEHNEA